MNKREEIQLPDVLIQEEAKYKAEHAHLMKVLHAFRDDFTQDKLSRRPMGVFLDRLQAYELAATRRGIRL